jgi:hypothetical protein
VHAILRRAAAPAVAALLLVASACGLAGERAVPAAAPADVPVVAAAVTPRPDHVVVVMLENKNRTSVIGSSAAPNLNSLAAKGANMSQSYGVTHPSQPNYLALFSGYQHGVTSDVCPVTFKATNNLASQLRAAGRSFTGYSESLPSVGYTGCYSGKYARKHAPWVNFPDLPQSTNQPFSAFPTSSTGYAKLPTVSIVDPNLCSDMHDCSVGTGDAWVGAHMVDYANWALTHNSLLVVTFDENAGGTVNQIATILVGQQVRRGTFAEQMNHYTLLRTLEAAYGLPALGNARSATPLSTIWTTSPAAAAPATGVTNPSFEKGLAGWAVSGSTKSSTTSRNGGTLDARAGSTSATTGDSILSQTITVPAGKTTLSMYWLGRCADVKTKAWATITVRRNTSNGLSTLLGRTCVANGPWTKVSVGVTPGHSYTINLVNHDDGVASTPNRTYFDDVELS